MINVSALFAIFGGHDYYVQIMINRQREVWEDTKSQSDSSHHPPLLGTPIFGHCIDSIPLALVIFRSI